MSQITSHFWCLLSNFKLALHLTYLKFSFTSDVLTLSLHHTRRPSTSFITSDTHRSTRRNLQLYISNQSSPKCTSVVYSLLFTINLVLLRPILTYAFNCWRNRQYSAVTSAGISRNLYSAALVHFSHLTHSSHHMFHVSQSSPQYTWTAYPILPTYLS